LERGSDWRQVRDVRAAAGTKRCLITCIFGL
jgi:hypothetical protein